MKNLLLGFVVLAFTACHDKAVSDLTIKGTLKNAHDTSYIYMEEASPSSQPKVLDSVRLKDGKFELSAPSTQEGLILLRHGHSDSPFAILISDSKRITVDVDTTNAMSPYTVSGSAATEQYLKLHQLILSTGNRMDSIRTLLSPQDSAQAANLSDSAKSALMNEYVNLGDRVKQEMMKVIEANTSPTLTIFTVQQYQGFAQVFNLEPISRMKYREILEATTAKFPDNKAVKDELAQLKPSPAPDFTMADTSGKQISLSSFKGKWVLVDFWASWCKPCREENPNVVAAYNQFKDKNFTVLGVSLDKDRASWLQAIKQDGLTWTHVSDLQYWNNAAATQYGIQSIPFNVLVDPSGNIVASELRGDELQQTLAKYVK